MTPCPVTFAARLAGGSRPSCFRFPDERPSIELIEELASDGLNLQSYSNHMSIIDLQKVAKVFGIDSTGMKRDEVGHAVWQFVLDYDKRQQQNAFHKKSGVAKLTKQELRAEVEALVKPCVHLTRNPKDGPFAGIWGGPGIVPAPASTRARPDGCPERPQYRHWISLNCAALPAEFAPLQLDRHRQHL